MELKAVEQKANESNDLMDEEDEDARPDQRLNSNDLENVCQVKQPNRCRNFYGILLAFMTALFHSLMSVTVKQTYMLTSTEQTTVRYFFQMVIMGSVMIYKRISPLDYKSQFHLLAMRAVLGVAGLISAYLALKFINPSDSVAVSNMSVIITAILSRLVLKEKLSLVHLISTMIAITGVVFISQPSFIFGKHRKLDITNHTNSSTVIKHHVYDNESSFYLTLGICVSLVTAMAQSGVTVILKKLQAKKVHLSLNIFLTSLIGLPISILISLLLILTEQSQLVDHFRSNMADLKFHLGLVVISSLFGILAQVFINMSLKYEDASKVSIIKTSEIFFSFLLQYFILEIKSNVFKILGGLLIFISVGSILVFKMLDQKNAKKANKRPSLFKRIFFFKF